MLAGEIVQCERKLVAAQAMITELSENVAKWKLDIECSLVPNDGKFDIMIKCTKPNGQGLFLTISESDALIYADDLPSKVASLTDHIIDMLYYQQISKQLAQVLTPLVNNIIDIKGRNVL